MSPMMIPSQALDQMKMNQLRRRGKLALENCNLCGKPCDFNLDSIVTLFRQDACNITMHKSCSELWNMQTVEDFAGIL